MNSQWDGSVAGDGGGPPRSPNSLAASLADQLNVFDGHGGLGSTGLQEHGPSVQVDLGDLNSDGAGSEGSDADTELAQDVVLDGNTDPVPVTTTPNDQFVCPDDELVDKIVKQVEYYFSDENILTDAYLLKHIKRNKQGYVSIKVISTFRKTKKLSKDPRVIAYALRKSDKLQVNEPGTKVRRIDPLPMVPAAPEVDCAQRTVVASNLTMENPSMESVVEQFSKCGNITQVRILRPGNSVPADVKKYLDKHLEVGSKSVYALVEYENLAGATKACKTLTDTGDWRRGMRVVMLIPPAKKDDKNTDLKGTLEDKVQDSDGMDSGESKKNKKKKKRNSRVMELAHGESPYSSGSDADRRKSPCRDLADGNSKGKITGGSPRSSPKGSPTAGRRSGNAFGRSPLAHDSENEDWRSRSSSFGAELGTSPSQSLSPWVQRRLKAQQESGCSPPGRSPVLGRRSGDAVSALPEAGDFHKMAETDRIVRQPRGPDGTKGFKMNRSNAVINSC